MVAGQKARYLFPAHRQRQRSGDATLGDGRRHGQKKRAGERELLGSLLEPEKQKATQGTGLARATPQDYQWAPDGKALLFVSDTALVWLDLASMKSKR